MSLLAALPLLLIQAAALPPTLQPVPEALRVTFTNALRKSAAFAPATGRVLDRELKGFSTPEAPFPAWVVEFHWKEKTVNHTGVAMLIDIPAFVKTNGASESEIAKELKAREGVWGLATIFEDRTFDQWREQMLQARRSAYEASAIGDIRTMMSAQMAYSYGNGGAYDELRCLLEPPKCLAGSKEQAFIDRGLTLDEKGGFRRKFYPGPPFKEKGVKSASSIASFAYTAFPASPETGTRGFCGDASGEICFTPDGSEPKVAAGRCARPCQLLK